MNYRCLLPGLNSALYPALYWVDYSWAEWFSRAHPPQSHDWPPARGIGGHSFSHRSLEPVFVKKRDKSKLRTPWFTEHQLICHYNALNTNDFKLKAKHKTNRQAQHHFPEVFVSRKPLLQGPDRILWSEEQSKDLFRKRRQKYLIAEFLWEWIDDLFNK